MNTNNEPRPGSGALGPLRMTLLAIVFLWFAVGGVAHFVFTKSELRIMPPYIPSPLTAVYVSGLCELLGALGILVPRTRRAAGVGLFLLTLAVTPANVYMLQNADDFHMPRWALIARLFFQVILLAMIWWSTSTPKQPASLASR